MQQLNDRIKQRLISGAYPNEASVSHGIVIPLLGSLGWDTSDPELVLPEFTSGKGRVDFALCCRPNRPNAFIEVKGVGRSLDGDRQLFEYAFHQGVQLCVLTDGREWSFYLPSGQGSYDERRVYRLQMDDRDTDESVRIFKRYLSFERVKSGEALEDAQRDYKDASARREAKRIIPAAWTDLVRERDDLLIELLADKAEAKSGFRPSNEEIATFLARLVPDASAGKTTMSVDYESVRTEISKPQRLTTTRAVSRRDLTFTIFGSERSAPNANHALIEVLSTIAQTNPSLVEQLSIAVQSRSRNHIARTVAEIYPSRPDLARAEEFHDGWLIGLNIANREKLKIIKLACDVYGLRFGQDLKIDLPNAE